MKTKKYILSTIFGFGLVEFIWRSGAIKVLALPISLFFLVDKSKETFWALFFGTISVIIYFFTHGYSGAHDLKSLLLLLHFLIPVAICRFSLHDRKVIAIDIFKILGIFLIASILLQGMPAINTFDAQGERFRGFVLFAVLALMQIYYKGSLLQRVFLAVFIGFSAFLISGSRQDSLILLISGLLISLRNKYCLPFIILAYVAVPPLVILVAEFLPDEKGTIMVRSISAQIALNNFNLFGNGMIPPVKEFLSSNNFGHFFVPADTMYFGSIYETGLVIFLMKLIFCIYIANRYWGKSSPAVIYIASSAAIFDYNLTHMVFELSASAIVFSYLRRATV